MHYRRDTDAEPTPEKARISARCAAPKSTACLPPTGKITPLRHSTRKIDRPFGNTLRFSRNPPLRDQHPGCENAASAIVTFWGHVMRRRTFLASTLAATALPQVLTAKSAAFDPTPQEVRVKRQFKPNLRHKRIWVPELGRYVRVKVSARGLKTIDKNGAYKTLKEAGLI